MVQEVVAYRADSGRLRDIVDMGLHVLLKVDINAWVDLKDKYLEYGLREAIRDHSHLFWQSKGVEMWNEIQQLVNARIHDAYWFGQHHEDPEVVGIFEKTQ